MDPTLYKAATKGDVDFLSQYKKDKLLTQISYPAKHMVLHVIAQYNDSADAIGAILSDQDSCNLLKSLLTWQNAEGETALYIAARNRHKLIVEELLKRAGEVSPDLASRMAQLANKNGDTPLHEAVNNKDGEIVELLVKADPNYRHLPNKMGKTPLYIALEKRVNEVFYRLARPLFHSDDFLSSYDPTLKAILEICESPGVEGPHGETVLHAAARRKRTSHWIGQICERFPDIKKKQDDQGFTPLHHAAYFNNYTAAKELLEAEKSMAYISAAEDKHQSMTPIHIAASKGHTEVIEQILENCEDCWDALTTKGQNILHLAANGRYSKTLSYIVKQPWAINLLNSMDNDGNTPSHLLLSSMPENYKTLKPLLEEGNVYVDVFNKNHSTPLEMFNKSENQFTAKKISILEKLKHKFGRVEKIPWMIDDSVNGNSNNEVKETQRLEEMRKTAETQLVVAALIATVTFAAGFTLPGGYDSKEGENQGTALLIKKAAFKAFVVTDTIAVISSFAAIFLHFTATLYKRDEEKISKRYKSALLFLIVAMISMAITFVTGLYIVLEKSPAIAITVGVIGGSGILFLLYLIRRVYTDMGVKFMADQYFFATIFLLLFAIAYGTIDVISRCLKFIRRKVRGFLRVLCLSSGEKAQLVGFHRSPNLIIYSQ